MKPLALVLLVCFALPVVLVGVALTFGGPADPGPMPSISNPFKTLDYSGLPEYSRFAARDGTTLAFRHYPSTEVPARGSVFLVHGSSANGRSMHVLAKGFATAGYSTFALDIRGHGESGIKGQIAYVGQLEDDLEDFVHALNPMKPCTLAGYSSGGGFALRVAGSARQTLFSNYLLLSPFIGRDSPTQRPDSGGWVRVGLPRLLAISLLNACGMRTFNRLPVVRFALDEEARALLTPSYAFALALNFQPQRNYRANIRAVHQPVSVVAGQADEAFHTDQFAGLFRAEGKEVPVTLVPGTSHIGLILGPAAIQAAVEALRRLDDHGGRAL